MTLRKSLPRVHVIRQGFVLRMKGEIVDASSSVTVVDTDKGRFIVDTGAPKEMLLLSSSLAKAKVRSDSIDFIVNTHLHSDHCGGNEMFPRARVFAHEFEAPPLGSVKVVGDMPLATDVSLVITPGHTAGSMSVFVEAEKRYAICGDALPTQANYTSMSPPAIHIDRRLALMSMDRILTWADIVIPGHDAPFEVSERSKSEKRNRPVR